MIMTPTAASTQNYSLRMFGSRVGTQNISLLIALIALVVIFGFIRPDVFFTGRNLINIGLSVTISGILFGVITWAVQTF